MGLPVHELPLPDFLKVLGKQEIKPGGVYATRKAVENLNITHLDTLLVVGPDSAAQGFHLAMTTRSHMTALVANLAEALPADDAALARHCRFDVGSLEKLPQEDATFSAVLIEATLSFISAERRAVALKEAARVLKPGGRIALNELCWRQPPTAEVEAALSAVWRGEVHPLVTRGWWDALEAAGFNEVKTEQAVVSYFTPKGMALDEIDNAANVFHSAFEDPKRQERFSKAYREFTDNRRYHGVIIASAIKR